MTKPGNKLFQIEYIESVVEEDIPALSKTMRSRIKTAIESWHAVDPISFGKPLRYSFVGHRRIRVGDYRIVYRLEMNRHAIIIVLVKHRKDVYEE